MSRLMLVWSPNEPPIQAIKPNSAASPWTHSAPMTINRARASSGPNFVASSTAANGSATGTIPRKALDALSARDWNVSRPPPTSMFTIPATTVTNVRTSNSQAAGSRSRLVSSMII